MDIAERYCVEHMRWDEVASRLSATSAAILPIGAASKQHGFHLPLNSDRIQAEWLAANLAKSTGALIWPTIIYGYYPAFVAYAGTNSLSSETFEALVREVATGIFGHGCRRLLVLNAGISSIRPVESALASFERSAVLHLRIYDGPRYRKAASEVAQPSHGTHADELETSLMLAIAPHLVDMSRAEASPARDFATPGPLTPLDVTSPNYSRSGSYGDPAGATSAKGTILLSAMLADLHAEVASFISESRDSSKNVVLEGGEQP